MTSRRFVVWAAGDAHVGADIRHGRESLGEAIRQSERGGDNGGPSFEWDVMVDVGDMSAAQGPPDDQEGTEVVRQYGELTEHHRGQVYNVAGNHDASGPDEATQWWFRKYLDPMGENPDVSGVISSERPYPPSGTWERYSFTVGNVLFLMMSDRNDGGPPVGRAHGGYPAGAVTGETFDWWVNQVEANRDKTVVSVHHHMLRSTTIGSGPWEGFEEQPDRFGNRRPRYHGYFPDGGPMGAGYLYWVDGNPDAQAFERYLHNHPKVLDLWVGGHSHAGPDDLWHGRGHYARRWGTSFLNCAALTQHHVISGQGSTPMSRTLTFTEGQKSIRVRCYLHTDQYAPQGWYDRAELVIPLKYPFEMD